MSIKHNRTTLGKAFFLLIMMFVVMGGVNVMGCVQGGVGQARGWSGVAVKEDTMFLGSMDGKLVALDAEGKWLWETVLEASQPQSRGFGCAPAQATSVAIYGSPVVGDDLVYAGGYNGKVYAINSANGALRWVYPRMEDLKPIVGGSAVAQGKLYIGSSDGKLYALDAATGDGEWEFETGNKIWAAPAVEGSTVYIGSFDKKLYALNTADGSRRWEFEAEGALLSTPLVYDSTVYIGSFDRHLYAINSSDGTLKWKYLGGNGFWARPVAYNGVIYAGCLDGKVYAIDARSGNGIAEFDVESPVSSSPVLTNSAVIVASEEGKIFSIDTTVNQIRWLADVEKKKKICAPLSAADEVVYIHTDEGSLILLNAVTGVTLWSLQITGK
ncbi:PQQ-binding-like beta-propeller repeat protein [Chloroflexota bacterium]